METPEELTIPKPKLDSFEDKLATLVENRFGDLIKHALPELDYPDQLDEIEAVVRLALENALHEGVRRGVAAVYGR